MKPPLFKRIAFEATENRSTFIVYVVLRALVLVTLVVQLFSQNYENAFLCLLTLGLLIIPSVVQAQFSIDLPSTLEIIILLFIFAAEILGEIRAFYIIFPFWDTVLHTLNGFLAAAIGFSLVDILNASKRFSVELSPLFMAITAFCFSMTIGALWEIFEYLMDCFAGFDMQKDTIVHSIATVTLDPTATNTVVRIDDIKDVMVNGSSLGLGGYLDIGLHDTMADLIVNLIGAVVFSFFGYFHVKSRGKDRIASRFIPVRKKKRDTAA